MQKVIRGFHILDYVVGVGTLGYGLYEGAPLIAALGCAGLVLARLNLAQRLSAKVQAYFLRKRGGKPLAPVMEEPEPTGAVGPVGGSATVSYAHPRLTTGSLKVGSSRHSLLRSADALNHASLN